MFKRFNLLGLILYMYMYLFAVKGGVGLSSYLLLFVYALMSSSIVSTGVLSDM